MSDDTADRLDRFRAATVSTVRALSGIETLEVSFQGIGYIADASGVRLPALPKSPDDPAADSLRGAADMAALSLRFHDKTLHSALLPADAQAQMVYQALEEVRIEALGARDFPGTRANIAAKLHSDADRQKLNAPKTSADAPLAEAVRYLARQALTGQKPVKSAERTVRLWEEWITRHHGEEGFEQLRHLLDDQKAFALQVQQLMIGFEMNPAPESPAAESPGDDDEGPNDTPDDQPADEKESPAEDTELSASDAADASDMEGAQSEQMEGQMLDDHDESGEGTDDGGDFTPPRNSHDQLFGDYRAYTTAFDEIVAAEDLCDPEELQKLRQLLDRQIVHLQSMITRLANRLQRQLLARQTRAWMFDLEEGILDSARLSRVVANPSFPVTYKQETDTEFRDTVVTLLIDNSGSMRGRPITIAAMSTDILARTLERCGVKVEILGFTTRAWKGGTSRERWLADGKPALPGRLNDLRHIVYKPADTHWRHARDNLGLMLREGLLKENIDGEALLWAANRLLARPEQRRIMMVISDGAPVDDSTLSANPGNYLEEHLRRVIAWIETRTPIQLLAIGIGHDVTRYYQRAVTLSDAEDLGAVMTGKLAELFAEKPARKHRAI